MQLWLPGNHIYTLLPLLELLPSSLFLELRRGKNPGNLPGKKKKSELTSILYLGRTRAVKDP